MVESYLVIGGCGFLGGHIVDLLLQRGEQAVAVFDVVIRDVDPRVVVFPGDLTNESDLRNAIQQCGATCIITTASVIGGVSREVMHKVNVGGMKSIINVALELDVKKLVYTSSASVVFDGTDQNGIDETRPYPTRYLDDYTQTKAEAERLVLEANGKGTLNTTSLRVAGLFGTRDRLAVGNLMNTLVQGRHTVQLGNNTNLFDWTFIVNAAAAHLLAADRLSPSHPKHSLVAGQAFFITNGEPWPFWNLARGLWATAIGHEVEPPIVLPYPMVWFIGLVSEVSAWFMGKQALLLRSRALVLTCARWCNITKARTALDYHSEISMDDAVKRSVEWWLSEHPEFKGAAPPSSFYRLLRKVGLV